ncbi:hypothetical protein BJ165DRAFT_1458863 [Panaeolus papilionaceus]|nr:hypothetical protein BJ165DRAFT_1458863 [Panaeolus papilionaceus]
MGCYNSWMSQTVKVGLHSLLGATGAGKSTFVESCAEIKTLSISKNSLESVTQKITAYRLINVQSWVGEAIYLVDTPGFLDHNVSEMKIVKQVQDWLRKNHLPFFHRVIYLDRITDIRMSCSKKRTMNMIKSLTGWKSARSITILTTQWDQLWNEEQNEKAEARLKHLNDDHWKDYTSEGTRLVKFRNTQASALQALDACMSEDSGSFFHFEPRASTHLSTPSYPALTYQNLLDRISELEQKVGTIDEDLKHAEICEDALLEAVLCADKAATVDRLRIFRQELEECGGPPPGFAERCGGSIHSRRAVKATQISFHAQPSNRSDSLELWHCDTPTHASDSLVDSPQRTSFFDVDLRLNMLTFNRSRR